jgi:hypothetical protein
MIHDKIIQTKTAKSPVISGLFAYSRYLATIKKNRVFYIDFPYRSYSLDKFTNVFNANELLFIFHYMFLVTECAKHENAAEPMPYGFLCSLGLSLGIGPVIWALVSHALATI